MRKNKKENLFDDLMDSISKNNITKFKKILPHKSADMSFETDERGNTPFLSACSYGRLDMIQEFMKKTIVTREEAKREDGKNALSLLFAAEYSASTHNIESEDEAEKLKSIVKFLMKIGISISTNLIQQDTNDSREIKRKKEIFKAAYNEVQAEKTANMNVPIWTIMPPGFASLFPSTTTQTVAPLGGMNIANASTYPQSTYQPQFFSNLPNLTTTPTIDGPPQSTSITSLQPLTPQTSYQQPSNK